MDEYLACICARAGHLHEALNQQFVDDALFNGAADIIRALLQGGPAEGIDDYEKAADSCGLYVNQVWVRRDLDLRHFLTIARLREFLASQRGWDSKRISAWTEASRREILTLCEDIYNRESWRQQVSEALSSSDSVVFEEGDLAAKELSIDTWEIHFNRVQQAPLTSSSWYRLMQQTDESRIDRVLEFAESAIPFSAIETGVGDELGLGGGTSGPSL